VGSWLKNGLLAELLFFIGLSSDCNSLSFSFLAAYLKEKQEVGFGNICEYF
jgi:hypothetical protein